MTEKPTIKTDQRRC